jgi:hypothetical protein
MIMACTVGEQLGQHLADGRAVAEAQVVELLVADAGPHGVDVAGDVLGAQEREHVAGRGLAGVYVVLADFEQRGGVLGRVDAVVDPVELGGVGVVATVDVAAAEAAGVHAHDVEVLDVAGSANPSRSRSRWRYRPVRRG